MTTVSPSSWEDHRRNSVRRDGLLRRGYHRPNRALDLGDDSGSYGRRTALGKACAIQHRRTFLCESCTYKAARMKGIPVSMHTGGRTFQNLPVLVARKLPAGMPFVTELLRGIHGKNLPTEVASLNSDATGSRSSRLVRRDSTT